LQNSKLSPIIKMWTAWGFNGFDRLAKATLWFRSRASHLSQIKDSKKK